MNIPRNARPEPYVTGAMYAQMDAANQASVEFCVCAFVTITPLDAPDLIAAGSTVPFLRQPAPQVIAR